jgi:membrane protease subunit HflK
MPPQNGNGPRGGPWGSEATPGSDIKHLLLQRQDRLKQILPSGGPSAVIVFAILVLAALGAWTAYYTVPSDSVAVVQRFGKYLKDVPPGLHFKLPLGIDAATIVPVKRQLKQEFGFLCPSPRKGSFQRLCGRNGLCAGRDARSEFVIGQKYRTQFAF